MRTAKRGSNQHRTKYKGLRAKVWRDVIYLIICIILVSVMGHKVVVQQVKLISPIPKAYADLSVLQKLEASPSPTPSSTRILTQDDILQQQQIEEYVYKIFGNDADTALAISHHECSPANTTYPACILHTDAEYSVGLFQINLYNSAQWIHAGRIPGQTMDEKIEWLKNPENNTLYAYWVFTTSGWNPWSTYQNGSYLNN